MSLAEAFFLELTVRLQGALKELGRGHPSRARLTGHQHIGWLRSHLNYQGANVISGQGVVGADQSSFAPIASREWPIPVHR